MLSGNFQSQCEDSTFYLICADFSICYEIHDSCVKAFSRSNFAGDVYGGHL